MLSVSAPYSANPYYSRYGAKLSVIPFMVPTGLQLTSIVSKMIKRQIQFADYAPPGVVAQASAFNVEKINK